MSSSRTRSASTVRTHLYDWLTSDLPTDARRDAEYSGDLRRPLPTLKPSARISEAQRRLDLLFDCLAIPRGDFEQLAIALTCRHVPGFQPQRRSIASKRKTPAAVQRRLRKAVRLLLAQRGVTNELRDAGRPHKLSAIEQQQLVSSADDWHREQRASGVARTTDADFLRSRSKDLARLEGVSEKKAVSRWANRLSRARKALSKPLP